MISCYLQDFLKWRDPDSNRGHHDFQSSELHFDAYHHVLILGLAKLQTALWTVEAVHRVLSCTNPVAVPLQ
jgi:hypothetical protein